MTESKTQQKYFARKSEFRKKTHIYIYSIAIPAQVFLAPQCLSWVGQNRHAKQPFQALSKYELQMKSE